MAQLYYTGFESLAVGAASPDFNPLTGTWAVVSSPVANGTKAYGNTSQGDGFLLTLSAKPAQADVAVQASQKAQIASYANISLCVRMSADGQNFYLANPQTDGNTLRLYKCVAGAFTQLTVQPFGFTTAEGQVVITKLEASGTTIRAKVWPAGSAEPSSWTATATDADITTGYVGARSGTYVQGAATPNFDDFFMGDAGTTFAVPSTVLQASDALCYKSPAQWRAKGGAMRTNCSNAELRIRFTGSANLALTNDMTNALTSNVLAWSVDGGPLQTASLAAQMPLASSLDPAAIHEVRAWILVFGQNGDRWTASATQVWDALGFTLDSGATCLVPSSLPQWCLVYMDSLGENANSRQALGANVAAGLGMESGLRAFGGTGIGTNNDLGNATNVGQVPPLASAYGRFDSSTALAWSTPPAAVVVIMGINDMRAGGSSSTTQGAVATVATGLRAKVGVGVPIYWCVPVGGQSRADITAAVNAAKAADPQLYLVDSGTLVGLDAMGAGGATLLSADGFHPNPLGTLLAVARVTRAIAAVSAPSSSPTAAAIAAAVWSASGRMVQLDLTQAVPLTNVAHTLGDSLNAARAEGFGKWAIFGTTLNLYAADNTTVVKSFTLNSATNPTQRV